MVSPQDDASDAVPDEHQASGNGDDTLEHGTEIEGAASVDDDDVVDIDEHDDVDEDDDYDDYGAPFEARSFGGEFAWADTPSFTCKILRVKPGENVIVSTKGRKDMHAMLTGGRAMLEIHGEDNDDRDQIELLPAAPIRIEPGRDYRLVAITEVELFTVYAPAGP